MEKSSRPEVFRLTDPGHSYNTTSVMETPITDKAKRKIDGFADEWVPRYVSEELERHLTIAREALEIALVMTQITPKP